MTVYRSRPRNERTHCPGRRAKDHRPGVMVYVLVPPLLLLLSAIIGIGPDFASGCAFTPAPLLLELDYVHERVFRACRACEKAYEILGIVDVVVSGGGVFGAGDAQAATAAWGRPADSQERKLGLFYFGVS
ncbi:hypothetical protein MRX96_055584 [Rhipicephalus microplus]